jgi:hypothetical protein
MVDFDCGPNLYIVGGCIGAGKMSYDFIIKNKPSIMVFY